VRAAIVVALSALCRAMSLIEVNERMTPTDCARQIDLDVIGSSYAENSLVAVTPRRRWFRTGRSSQACAPGMMPHVWAGGQGTSSAPIMPLVEALENLDRRYPRSAAIRRGKNGAPYGHR
jgi:hypothetical protein